MAEPVSSAETSALSTGQLVGQLSASSSQLIRDEIRLAQLELTEKGKRVGLGAGMFGAAGVVALYALGVGIATAVIALALVVDAWLAGLIVFVVLLAVAGVLAMVGRRSVSQGTPLAPEETVASVKKDVAAVKGARS